MNSGVKQEMKVKGEFLKLTGVVKNLHHHNQTRSNVT